MKAKERMMSGKPGDPAKKSSEGETSQIVAQKMGIESKDTYHKEKYIVDNKDSLALEDFLEWDEGKLSTNKAFQKIKEEKKLLEEQVKKLELSNQNMQNYVKLTEMIPELEDLIDTGIVTKDAVLALMDNLSDKEHKDLIESNLRQRVLGYTNPVKLRRCFDFWNNYYGFTQGGNKYTLPREKVFT